MLPPDAMVKSRLVLSPRAVFGSMALEQQGSVSMSVTHVTTNGPYGLPLSGLLPGTLLMFKG